MNQTAIFQLVHVAQGPFIAPNKTLVLTDLEAVSWFPCPSKENPDKYWAHCTVVTSSEFKLIVNLKLYFEYIDPKTKDVQCQSTLFLKNARFQRMNAPLPLTGLYHVDWVEAPLSGGEKAWDSAVLLELPGLKIPEEFIHAMAQLSVKGCSVLRIPESERFVSAPSSEREAVLWEGFIGEANALVTPLLALDTESQRHTADPIVHVLPV